MKRTPHHHILKFALFISIICLYTVSHAQHVLSQLEVQGGSWHAGNEYMVSDPNGNIYLGFKRNSWIPATIGDTIIYGSRLDTVDFGLSDFFYAKLDQNHRVQNVFVIDNAEYVLDFNATNDHSFISMTLFPYEQEDSLYPIILGGDLEVPREGNRGHGVLVVLDKDLKLEKALIPSTGELGQVAADGDYVYMELLIPDQAPYILVGEDTVHNFILNEGGLEYGFQTVVLCKYDYVNEQVIWWKRIGNAGSEVLKDMLLDSKGNLVIHGWTSSRKFTFSETDTILNYQADKPFIGKYSPSGDFIWGILNTNQNGENFYYMSMDAEDNIYEYGYYNWAKYRIGDTVLLNPDWVINGSDKALIIKYDKNGAFSWITQLEGHFAESTFYDATYTPDQSLILSGMFRNGTVQFGNIEYIDGSDENVFLWKLDARTGKNISHAFDTGPEFKWIPDIISDPAGNLSMYMIFIGEEEIFGNDFASYQGNISAFLIKLSTDFPSSFFELHQKQKKFKIFPNPVSAGSIFYINTIEKYKEDYVDFAISDLPGNIVRKGSEYSSNGRVSINTTGLIPGVYFISIGTGSITRTEMLILE